MKPNLRDVTLVCYENRDHEAAVSLVAHQCGLVSFGAVRLLNWFQGREQFIYWENYETWRYVTTSHMLSIHLDGYIIHPYMWDPAWLQYDYIGAPWPLEWNSARVGNGGFCLKSRRLLNRVAQLPWMNVPSDILVCNHYRELLLAEGYKFAPLEIAALFSVELRIPEAPVKTFGFHGMHDGRKPWEACFPIDSSSST
jgi:hypothetical protein